MSQCGILKDSTVLQVVVDVGTVGVICDLTRRLQVDEITTHAPGSYRWRLQNNVGVLAKGGGHGVLE